MAEENENVVPTDRVEQVRQELRNGRRDTKATLSNGEDATTDRTEHGSILQVLPGEGQRVNGPDRGNGDTQRSAEEESERVRRANRRLGENNSRANDPVSATTNANQRTVGRLEASEPIPSRLPDFVGEPEPKRGRGRPRKEVTEAQEERETPFSRLAGAAKEQKAKFTEGKPLSKKEVEELREPFIEALKDDFKYLDEAIWWYSHDKSEPQIWSDLDDEEIEVIARVMLRRAERSPAAATLVRNIVDASDYVNVAVITVPRTIKTMQQLNKRPKKKGETA